MSTTFFLRSARKSGYASVCVRVQSSVLKVNIRQSTRLKVPVQKWNLARTSPAFRDYVTSEEGRIVFGKIEEIRQTIDAVIIGGKPVTASQVRHIVHDVVYKGYITTGNQSMTLGMYMDIYIDQVTKGIRKTQKGTDFSEGTVRSVARVRDLMLEFQAWSGRTYDFDDIDFDFRSRFMCYMYEHKDYNINTAAKSLNTLITMMSAAEAEGYHANRKCLSRQFKAKRKDVDEIYLTKEELTAISKADISTLPKLYEKARDLFMVGVYTAQRVSDYNNIGPDNIIRNPDGSVIINLRQKKTGVWVSIPAKDELKRILEKYSYRLPKVPDKSINLCIKEVARLSGVDSPVTIETTSGGRTSIQTHPKYALIHTHTARRTGATLMYLAGMDVFNICSVTGHSSISMLKKYIKADKIERARTISSDAAFTKW